jgi:signal transduction histidine kinase
MPYLKTSFFIILLILSVSSAGQIKMTEFQPGRERILKEQQTLIDTALRQVYKERKKDPDMAIARMEELFTRSQSIGYDYGMAFSSICIGNMVVNIKGEEDASPALHALRRAYPYLEAANRKDGRLIEMWYNLMGATFAKLSEPDSAMSYYAKGLDIGLRKNPKLPADQYALALNYLSIESIFLDFGQIDKVIYYGRQSAKLAKQYNLVPELFKSYSMLAGAFAEQGAMDSSQYYFSLIEKMDYQPQAYELRVLHEFKGNLYLNINQPEEAIRFLKKAIAANDRPAPRALRGLGIAYQQLGQYDEAEKYLSQAKDRLLKTKAYRSTLISVCNHLADVYSATGNYKEAYENRSVAALLQREMDDAQKVTVVNALEGQFRKAEQDKQLAEDKFQLVVAKEKVIRQRSWIAGITLLSLSLSIVIIALYQKQKLQRQRAVSLVQNQEIEKLRASIEGEEKERSRIGRELHDDIMVQLSLVKMNLEALPAQVPGIEKVNDFVSVKEQLRIAGRDLRQTAHNLSPDTLLADGLTQALIYFFKNVQYRTKLNVNFQHYGQATRLPQESEINIYRIAQELVQNIIKHAKAKSILIQLNYREDNLTLTIEDDGIGFESGGPGKEGIGLKSIRSRLKVMNGTMDIHTRHPQGTSITIEIYV